LAAGIIAWLLPEKIRVMLCVEALRDWLPIAVWAGVATAVLAIGTSWLNRIRAYLLITQLRIVQSVVGAFCGIILGLYGYTTGILFAQITSLLVVVTIVMVTLRTMYAYCSKQALCNVAIKYNAAPKYLLPTALLDVVTLQLPVLLITAWFSSEKAGQFSMAWKILAMPMALIGGTLGQVFLQRFSNVWPDANSARRMLFSTWKILAFVGVLPTILFILLGEDIFTLIFGNAWGEAGRMAAVIAPMLFAILVSSPTSGIFLVLGLQQYNLFFGAAIIIYRSGCIYFGVINNNVLNGLAAWVVCELITIVVYNYIALKKMRVK
jgi:O-antigen/teichoic acid export membrane protein